MKIYCVRLFLLSDDLTVTINQVAAQIKVIILSQLLFKDSLGGVI